MRSRREADRNGTDEERADMDKQAGVWIRRLAIPFGTALLVAVGADFRQQQEMPGLVRKELDDLRAESVARLRHDSRGFLHPEVDAALTAHVRRLIADLLTREEFSRWIEAERQWKASLRQLNPAIIVPAKAE